MKLNLKNDISIAQIMDVYSGMGIQKKISGTKYYYYHAQYWRNPVLSPYLFSKEQIDLKLLKSTEKHFAKEKALSPYDSKVAYINLIKNSSKSKGHLTVLNNAGWKRSLENRKFVINVWSQPIASHLPKGYSVKVGAYFDAQIHRDLWKTMNRNFPLEAAFEKYLNLWHRKIHKNVKAVVIYDPKKKPVASGLVITGKAGAFLYCGSVNWEHRNKGLWKCLVAIRQSISHVEDGIWVMLSENKLIKSSGQFCFPMETYVRKS